MNYSDRVTRSKSVSSFHPYSADLAKESELTRNDTSKKAAQTASTVFSQEKEFSPSDSYDSDTDFKPIKLTPSKKRNRAEESEESDSELTSKAKKPKLTAKTPRQISNTISQQKTRDTRKQKLEDLKSNVKKLWNEKMEFAFQCFRLTLSPTDFESVQKFCSNAVFYLWDTSKETSSSLESVSKDTKVPKSTQIGRYYRDKQAQLKEDLEEKVTLLKEEIKQIKSIFQRYSPQKIDAASAATAADTETFVHSDVFSNSEADYENLAPGYPENVQTVTSIADVGIGTLNMSSGSLNMDDSTWMI